MGKRSKTSIAILILLLLIFGLYWMFSSREDAAQMQKVREMGVTLFTEKGPPDRSKMDAFRKEMDKLSDNQRHQMMEEHRQEMEARQEKHLDEYFAMDKAHRQAFLDAEIKRMEERRKEMESRGPEGGPPPGPPPGGEGGPPPGGEGGPPPDGPGGGRRGGGGGGPHTRPATGSVAEKNRRNHFLDHQAGPRGARMGEFISDMAERRAALGLSPMPEPPRRRPTSSK
jgi:hypothetical protein